MSDALYQAIYKRKSIRKFDMNVLPQPTLDEVLSFAVNAKPLADGFKYEFAILGATDVNNLLPNRAPHYLCLYSDKKDGYLMNAGYILQQVDLLLSMRGLGCCWLGIAKPNKDFPTKRNGLDYVIMLAFGAPAEPLHRENVSEFRRKSMEEITDISGIEELLEPVRLAPSASNSQAWFFTGKPDGILACRSKLNLVKAALYGRMNQIDMGIALYHLELSAGHLGKTVRFDFQEEKAPSGYEFMTKVLISDAVS